MIRHPLSPVLVLAALVFVWPLASQPAPGVSSEPEAAVRHYYAAFAAGDIAAMRGLWTTTDAPGFTETERTMRARCHTLHAVDVRTSEVSGSAATIEIDAWLSTGTPTRGMVRVEPQAVAFELTKGNGGGWKIASLQHAGDALAERIAAARPEEREALLESRERIDTPRLARALSRRAVAMVNAARLADAAQLSELARIAADRGGDVAGLASALSVRSILLRHQGASREGLRVAEEAYRLAATTGDIEVMASCMVRIVRALDSAGVGTTAVDLTPAGASASPPHTQQDLLTAVLDLGDELVDRATLAQAASQLARIHDEGPADRLALSHALLAARYAAEAGDAAAIVAALMNVAGFHIANGDPATAIPHLELAIERAQAGGVQQALPTLWQWLAGAHGGLGTGREEWAAVQGLRASASLGPDAAPDATVALLTIRAELELTRGRYEEAECFLREAIGRMDRCGDSTCIGGVWTAYARSRLLQNRYEEVLDAASIAPLTGGLGQEASVLYHATALQRTGRLEEARRILTKAIGRIEWNRDGVLNARQRALYLHQYGDLYRTLVDVLLDAGDVTRAFDITDAMRARLLREVLRQGGPQLDLTPAEREEERQINERIASLNRALRGSGGGSDRALRAELSLARSHLADFMTRVEIFHGAAPGQRADSPGAARRPIPEGTVALEYVVLQARTILFVLTRGENGATRVRAVPVAVPRERLEQLVATLRNQIEARHLGWRASANRLYALLVAPAERELQRHDRLVVLPDDVLWDLPFHVLGKADSELIATHAVSYATYAAGLSAAPKRDGSHAPATLVAFANPVLATGQEAAVRSMFRSTADLGPLPDAEVEAREIARLYGRDRSRVYVGAEAHEGRFKREAGDARVLHIGTHGVVDPADPMYSAILLAAGPEGAHEDGIVEARELAALQTRAEVAVLAACDTGRGQYRTGEGLLGLSWALLTTGCPRVVVSQWKAASRPTSELMIEFHRGLAAGAPAEEALRRAQRTLKAKREYAHPFYWAPFVVVANGH